MGYKIEAGDDFREYTRSYVGHNWVKYGLYAVFLILPAVVGGLFFATVYWPVTAVAAVVVLLTLQALRGPSEHDRILRVDKSEGVLTVKERRSGGEKLTHRVQLGNIAAVGTGCRPRSISRGPDRGYRTGYRYGIIFLLQSGQLVDPLALDQESHSSPGEVSEDRVQELNREVLELATLLGVEGVTVKERQTVKVVRGKVGGSETVELQPCRVPFGDYLGITQYQIPISIVAVIASFYIFGALEGMRKEYTGDTKEARIRAMVAANPAPRTAPAPVDDSPIGILRQGDYGKTRDLIESDNFKVNQVLKDGLTPLQIVCQEDLSPETAWFLLRSGADWKVKNHQGETPGDHLVKLYLESEDGLGENQCQTLGLLVENGYRVPLSRDNLGMTPLHHFVRDSRMDLAVEAMVEVQGVDVNLADDYGWTPLHHAFEARNQDLRLAFIRLSKMGGDPEIVSKKASGPALQRTEKDPFQRFKLAAGSAAEDLLQFSESPDKDRIGQ